MIKDNSRIYIKKLAELDAKLQQVDDLLKSLRFEMHEILWNLIESMKGSEKSNKIK